MQRAQAGAAPCQLVRLAAMSRGQQRSVLVAWFNSKWSKNLMTTGSRLDDYRSAFGASLKGKTGAASDDVRQARTPRRDASSSEGSGWRHARGRPH